MRNLAIAALHLGALAVSGQVSAAGRSDLKPTIVLVHGAFAGSSSWNGVITDLTADGYKVIAVANPLRGVKSDSAYLATLLGAIDGPVVLVGHSYGGEVINSAAVGSKQVKGLVFVAGVAPDAGGKRLKSRRPISRQHARRDACPPGGAARRRRGPLHSARPILGSVCSRRAGGRGRSDGCNPEAGH